ncbi:MAG TPA: hypothetical protein VFV38_14550, partial [Ktedonobacteraceae bacterium]|nr:hypothetical protein [Ktedonobacteraceae bacterium]
VRVPFALVSRKDRMMACVVPTSMIPAFLRGSQTRYGVEYSDERGEVRRPVERALRRGPPDRRASRRRTV